MATRFRAYQLGSEGASFSYCHNGYFILIEARLTGHSAEQVLGEVGRGNRGRVDCLHITSWDRDHCCPAELELILKYLKPTRIEYPGYTPHTDTAKESAKIIATYQRNGGEAVGWTPATIDTLKCAERLYARDVLLWPREIGDESNNNSTAKLFRRGDFAVLSLGDLEAPSIARILAADEILRNEVDVMILAHHGADNGFTTSEFIGAVKPSVAVCTSNYDNQYEHPKQEIRDLLYENEVRLYTTKTGDIIIEAVAGTERSYRAINMMSNNKAVSSVEDFHAKTFFKQNAA
jgi:competence protein ComEC